MSIKNYTILALLAALLFTGFCAAQLVRAQVDPARDLGIVVNGATITVIPLAEMQPSRTAQLRPSATPTDTPTQTITPSPTLTVTPSVTPTSTPAADLGIVFTPTPDRAQLLNDVPISDIIVLNRAARLHIREIYAHGQELGSNPHAFSKVGDSTIQNPFFLERFDTGSYNLGAYAYLQDTIDYYAGSFQREGMAVRRGLHSWSVFDPMWASAPCDNGEALLGCELRLHQPSILLVRLGSNDIGAPGLFESNLRQVIEFAIAQGVIPVLGTKADRADGFNSPNNAIIRRLAAEYELPLWDFDLVAETLPNRGLDIDGVHLNAFYPHDYTQREALRRGHSVHNLTALMMLDAIRRELAEAE